MAIDANKPTSKKAGKMTESLTDKLSTKLRHLLIDKDDFAETLCSMGSTSETEAHHARIIRRGYHVKGTLFFTNISNFSPTYRIFHQHTEFFTNIPNFSRDSNKY